MRRNKLVSCSPLWRRHPVRQTILTFILACSFFPIAAQEYPVQVTAILPPPYSIYLSDYGAPESNFQIIVRLRDLDRFEYRIKFRLTIEGMGITLRTKPSYSPFPVAVQGGVSEVFTGNDLRQYFQPDNLEFSGISRSEFLRKPSLPEGFYTFKVEVLDYNRSLVVSNTAIANAWVILNDPPLINLPFNNEKVIATDPQNIFFSWTPRHLASPNSAFNTEYEFTLVEVFPADRNPNDVMRSLRPIFQTITSATSLHYGMTETLLIPGRRYAFRIRAYDIGKRDLFKNSGYSEVYSFQFGDACLPPGQVVAQSLDSKRVKFSWSMLDNHSSAEIKVREKGTERWDRQSVFSNAQVIPQLKPATTYEYVLSAKCGSLVSTETPIATVTTDQDQDKSFVCGAPPSSDTVDTTPLLPPLMIDDVIRSSDFEVTITEVSPNGMGGYKGKGYAFMPWLNLASVEVKFHDIHVNRQYKVYRGNITTVFSKTSRFMRDLDLTEDNAIAGSIASAVAQSTTAPLILRYDGDIEKIVADVAAGSLLITNADGSTKTVEWPKKDGETQPAQIIDTNGDSWNIGKDGSVTPGPSSAAPNAIASAAEADFLVQFRPSENHLYGWDAPEGSPWLNYETLKIGDDDVPIAWKSIEAGRQDYISAFVDGKDAFPSIVGFKSPSAPVASQKGSNTGFRDVMLMGDAGDAQREVYAYALLKDSTSDEAEELKLGTFRLKSYDKIVNRLFVVPVNDARIPGVDAIATGLNRIYAPAVAAWDVYSMPPLQVDEEMLENIGREESGIAMFPEKMRELIRKYKREHEVDKHGYYLFVVTGDVADKSGFMPFKGQFGFVFRDNLNSDDQVITTMAHELGHGAFRLRHTFDEFGIERATTDNLMDYANAKTLRKYQWDNIHDPETMITWLADDEEMAGGISWSGTLIDDQHTELFDHIYNNNHIGELKYLAEIDRLIKEDPTKETLNLNYEGDDEHNAWVNSWKIRVVNSETVLKNTIKVIQDAKKGEKLGRVYLRPKHIYIAKHNYNDREYPIAIYNAGTNEVMDNSFTKVQVTRMDQLNEAEIKKRVYIEETFLSYFIVAFYEDGKSTPTLMIQVEKFPFSDLMHNSMEEWLKFLKILVEGQEEENNDDQYEELSVISGVQWVSQFDSGLFGDKSCFCKLKADSTCMNVCCNVASKHMLTQFGVTSIKNSNCLAVKTSANDYSSVKASGDFEKALQILETYIKPKDGGGEPILIGVHYPKTEYPGYENDCSATFHYMVVVGKGYDSEKKQNYFRFYDVGRTEESNGANISNRLYVDKKNKKISGTYKDKVYTITEVRSNHE